MEESISTPNQWQIKDIGQAFSQDGVGQYFIQLPKFQRSLVWSEDQRRMLVDSLYRGFPIGAVLGYQTNAKKGNRNVIQIVDGLQRTTSISEYLKQPLYFAPVDRVFSNEITKAVVRAAGLEPGSDSESRVHSAFETWMRNVKQARMGAEFTARKLEASVAKSLDVAEELFWPLDDLISNELGQVIDRVKNVESISVPVVLYSGDEGNIPTIFERINNQGTQLSKYEVLASTWVTAQTRITNKKIRDRVMGRYQSLIERGYEIEGLKSGVNINPEEYNLYEYLFGFGRLLAEEYPILFGDPGEADDNVPVAFVLVTTALGLNLNKMSKLAAVLKARMPGSDSVLDLSDLEAAIIKSVKVIHDALAPFLSLKLHKKDGGFIIAHSQNQILSLISAYLANKFDPLTWASRTSPVADKIAKNAAGHYLLDMVVRRWRGSGDSRLLEMTWQDVENLSPATYYSQAIQRDSLVDALISWHEDSLSKKQKERPNVPAVSQAVLQFLYSKLVPVYHDRATDFELEHIYPVAVIADRINVIHDDEGWPISALGNLMLLPKELNRIKGKNTLGDYIPNLNTDEALSKTELEDVAKYLITPTYEEITEASLVNRDFYIEFCMNRMKAISVQIADNLGL